jgi:arginine repressor
MLMNLLGAIGTLMDGSGIKEILGTIYGENTVQHIMTGKAV